MRIIIALSVLLALSACDMEDPLADTFTQSPTQTGHF